jgi:hypothetical protein
MGHLVSPLVLACTLLAAAAPQNPQVEARLRALFDKWDLDKDGFLDKDELARHFRGPAAKPPAEGMYDDKGNYTRTYYQARTKYPDLVFLWALVKDLDDRVSWKEFEQYGQAYAAALLQRAQAQQQLLQQIYRQASSRARATYARRANYVRHANRHPAGRPRHAVPHYSRNVANYQQNVARASAEYQSYVLSRLELQRNLYRQALARRQAWLRLYQSHVRQQMALYQNYVRGRLAFAYRMPQRHFSPTYRHAWRR